MTKVRFLMTTTVAGQRYAKSDVIDISEDIARYLIASSKAEVVPKKQIKDESADASAKFKGKD